MNTHVPATTIKAKTKNRSDFSHTKYAASPRVNKADRRWPSKIIQHAPQWCAVDLRDGNQALVEPMTVVQKQRMWALLVQMGFKEIEVGFPSASQPDYDFVRWLIEENQIPDDVTIQVLTQARDGLIERSFEALRGAKRAIMHVYNSTSPVQRNKVFNLDKQGIIDIAVHGAEKVKSEAERYPETQWQFQYSPESFSSTEIDFSITACNAVLNVWQPNVDQKAIINLPATVECAGPNVFADQVETFCDQIENRDNIIVSVHTHNDRGCAVAAAELAVMAGADRVEGTLMGNGERTGNMDLITMAMNLYSQGINPDIDIGNAHEITSTVEACTHIATHPRHPWMGELVYTAFSGSHQDAIKKCLAQQNDNDAWDVAYLPINPQDIGRHYDSVIRVNSQSGKGGVAYILEAEHGIILPRWMQIALSKEVQRYTEQHQCEVNGDIIADIFHQKFFNSLPENNDSSSYELSTYQVEKSDQGESIQATLSTGNDILPIHGQGHGALEAFCNAIQKALGIAIQIQHYDQSSLGEHSNAQAIAYVQVKIGAESFIGCAKDEDIISAGMNAVLMGLNQGT